MKHYNEQELDVKIHRFLAEKLQQYPELDVKSKDASSVTGQGVSTRLRESFTWFKPLATH